MITQKEAIANVNSKGYSTLVKVKEEVVRSNKRYYKTGCLFKRVQWKLPRNFFFAIRKTHFIENASLQWTFPFHSLFSITLFLAPHTNYRVASSQRILNHHLQLNYVFSTLLPDIPLLVVKLIFATERDNSHFTKDSLLREENVMK